VCHLLKHGQYRIDINMVKNGIKSILTYKNILFLQIPTKYHYMTSEEVTLCKNDMLE
jgi:predicted protein tyrosine phosphatase